MEIQFRAPFAPQEFKKCRCAYRLRRESDFVAYREVFEYCFVEPMLQTGQYAELREVPLAPDPHEATSFGQKMGCYELSNDRLAWAGEFFDRYHACGDRRRFIRREMFQTEYGRQLLEGSRRYRRFMPRSRPSRRACRRKVANLLTMYERMRAAGGLVPSSKADDFRGDAPWQYYDFPTAVDYFGYLKKRDGSHRRMIAAYLGLASLPTLVVDFASLRPDDLAAALPFLREGFAWFRRQVVEAHNRLSYAELDRASAGARGAEPVALACSPADSPPPRMQRQTVACGSLPAESS